MSKQKSTNFKPGSEYSYSNSNYSMLVIIVERVSKRSLEDFTAERLFKPLGMTNTRWRSNFRDIVPNRAQAYSRNDDAYELEMPFEHIHGHGGLLTTTGDLLKWNQLLEKHDAVYNKRIERGKLNSGKDISYAAGIQHGEVNGVAEIAHSGATAGYRAWLAYYPKKKLTIAILSNDASFGPVGAGKEIAEVFLGSRPPQEDFKIVDPIVEKDIPLDALEYVGEYYSDEAECSLMISTKDNSLYITNEALETTRLLHANRDGFFIEGNGIFRFNRNSKGKITNLNISVSRANNIPFKKISK